MPKAPADRSQDVILLKALVPLATIWFALGFLMPVLAHEPIFGLGSHLIFKGGVRIEPEVEITELGFSVLGIVV